MGGWEGIRIEREKEGERDPREGNYETGKGREREVEG